MLEKHGTPGAVVIWVQGDSVLRLEGFGFADFEQGRPVEPERTLLRIGSISKPFTAIGVLPQVERGASSRRR